MVKALLLQPQPQLLLLQPHPQLLLLQPHPQLLLLQPQPLLLLLLNKLKSRTSNNKKLLFGVSPSAVPEKSENNKINKISCDKFIKPPKIKLLFYFLMNIYKLVVRQSFNCFIHLLCIKKLEKM